MDEVCLGSSGAYSIGIKGEAVAISKIDFLMLPSGFVALAGFMPGEAGLIVIIGGLVDQSVRAMQALFPAAKP